MIDALQKNEVIFQSKRCASGVAEVYEVDCVMDGIGRTERFVYLRNE